MVHLAKPPSVHGPGFLEGVGYGCPPVRFHPGDDIRDDLPFRMRFGFPDDVVECRNPVFKQPHGFHAILARLDVHEEHRIPEVFSGALEQHAQVGACAFQPDVVLVLRKHGVAYRLVPERREESRPGGVVVHLLPRPPVRPYAAAGGLSPAGQVEPVEGPGAPVPDEKGLAVLVDDLGAVLRVVLPVAEERLELRRPDVCPQVRWEIRDMILSLFHVRYILTPLERLLVICLALQRLMASSRLSVFSGIRRRERAVLVHLLPAHSKAR